MFISSSFGAVPVPEKLQALQATYHKITLKWETGDGDETVSSYKIFRDDTQIGTSNEAQYTDSDLSSGTVYVYKVVAVSEGGNESTVSDTCSIKTIVSVPFDGSASVESVVDGMNPGASTHNTATMLLSAVQSGFEALFSTGITYTVIDGDLLSDFITEELNVINGASEDMTAAERLAAQQELDLFMSENYGENSFEHVYINSKLTELAEKHYFNGRKIAANELYELSLKYLSDRENVVSNSLHRMAYFKVAELTADSTAAEIASAVAAYKNTALRFFEFFPGAINNNAENIYYRVMQEHFKRFSSLLTYDNYQTQSYQDAAAMATALLELNNSTLNQDRVARVTAWELVQLTVNLSDANGNPANGLLTVSNVTAESDRKNVFFNSAEAEIEERTFVVTGGNVTIPVYSGHIYNLTVSIDVAGGNPLIYNINDIPHGAGTLLTCDHYAVPVVSELPAGTSGAQLNMIFNRPDFPYNLAWTQHADVFNLSWDWVDSDNFTLDHFVVYRGDTAIATVNGQQLNGIPYENTAGVYTYKVVAYDASGNASPDSQIVTIALPDMSVYSAYMAWREFYFGDNPQYASDDSDGDGVDNYTEFLLGTNPTRIPGTQWMELGQVAYSKATIKWDKVFAENANVTYTIYRNGEAVGTSTSESFTDSGLTPGVSYTYTVSAVNDATGCETEPGMALSLRTGAVVEFANSDKVRQVVDSLTPVNINEHTATTLIAAVKSGFEAVFGTSIAFTVVNEDILQDFVAAELELLGTEEDALTNAEKLAARTELRDFLDQHYNGNSFEHMYINAKLAELAEKHYQKGNTTAALELFEASLFYLKDCENIVSGTLSRLARIKLDAINDNSTNAEIIAALDASRDQYLRFFNYFAESSTNQALFSYTRPASEYFKYFPRLLTYDNYSISVFTSANDLAQSALEIDSSALIQARADNIAAWKLGSIKVDFSDSTDELLNGTLTVKNTSDHAMIWNYNENIPLDRVYSLAECPLTIPVYLGHKYDLKLAREVSGGNALEWTYNNIPLTPGQSVLFNNYAQAETALLSDPAGGAELKFVMDKPDYPYNLSAAIIADAFDLSWDWSDTATLNAMGYKVYRGGVELADVTNKTLSGIVIENESNVYNYTVKAYDVLGNLSASSQELIVAPPTMTAQLAAYYAWKQKYFGTNPSFSNEDPDGDGLTNWEEFPLNTNPTVASERDTDNSFLLLKLFTPLY
jgi:hypothetical protein